MVFPNTSKNVKAHHQISHPTLSKFKQVTSLPGGMISGGISMH